MTNILSMFKGERHELIPILQKTQERYGYLSRTKIVRIAEFVGMTESAVYGVATFYSQFHLKRQGKHKVKVCQGTACHVRGGKKIMETVEKQLGVSQGETTPDYRFSLERVACFGSCALAPVMVVDNRVYGRMTAQKARAILKKLR
jgi:NADH-quinone oxidoreductase subunit E